MLTEDKDLDEMLESIQFVGGDGKDWRDIPDSELFPGDDDLDEVFEVKKNLTLLDVHIPSTHWQDREDMRLRKGDRVKVEGEDEVLCTDIIEGEGGTSAILEAEDGEVAIIAYDQLHEYLVPVADTDGLWLFHDAMRELEEEQKEGVQKFDMQFPSPAPTAGRFSIETISGEEAAEIFARTWGDGSSAVYAFPELDGVRVIVVKMNDTASVFLPGAMDDNLLMRVPALRGAIMAFGSQAESMIFEADLSIENAGARRGRQYVVKMLSKGKGITDWSGDEYPVLHIFDPIVLITEGMEFTEDDQFGTRWTSFQRYCEGLSPEAQKASCRAIRFPKQQLVQDLSQFPSVCVDMFRCVGSEGVYLVPQIAPYPVSTGEATKIMQCMMVRVIVQDVKRYENGTTSLLMAVPASFETDAVVTLGWTVPSRVQGIAEGDIVVVSASRLLLTDAGLILYGAVLEEGSSLALGRVLDQIELVREATEQGLLSDISETGGAYLPKYPVRLED